MIAASRTGGPVIAKRAPGGARVSVLSFIVLETVAALWRNLFFNCSGTARYPEHVVA